MKKLALFATIVILATACNEKTQPTETKEEMKQELQLTQEWDKVFPLSDKVDHRKVTFETQYGLTLAADLYTPKAEAVADLKSATQEPGISNPLLPAIAVSGPFGAVKEQSSGLYAMRMAERGFVALAFDPSYTGESSGEPRRTASPDINTEDFMAAVDFLSKQDNVDAERIGIIGICGWGGIALNAAAADPRIKATVASTMYDMTRVSGNGYFDSEDKEKSRHTARELYAYTGFPRSLNALGTLQKVVADRDAKGLKTELGEDASPFPSNYDALKQGTDVQTKLSGQPFNYDFCPAEDYYLKAHLFGDIFARDNLTHADRELITVSALSGLENVMPQLQAHVRGALNMCVTEEQLRNIPNSLRENGLSIEASRCEAAIAMAVDGKTDVVCAQSPWPIGEPNTAYAQYFIGNSYLAPMDGGMVNVSFEPGCRNNWHIHHNQVQVLVCVSGRGWYQEWGKPAVELKPGVVIEIPEGVKHWHGASKDSWMQHLTYHKDVKENASNEWLEPVSDEQYEQL